MTEHYDTAIRMHIGYLDEDSSMKKEEKKEEIVKDLDTTISPWTRDNISWSIIDYLDSTRSENSDDDGKD